MCSLGVDFSSYGGALSPATVECWEGQGVDFACVQYSHMMRDHLEALKGSRIESQIYVYLYWWRDPWMQTPQTRVNNALNQLVGYDVTAVWLDAEDTTHPYQEEQLVDCENLVTMAGLEPMLYTGRWFWTGHAGNSQRFKHLRLVDAHYTGEGDPPRMDRRPNDVMDGFVPYGGWERPHIVQWHNTTTFCGHSVDLNIRESVKEEDLTIIHRPNDVKGRTYLLLGNVLSFIKTPDEYTSLTSMQPPPTVLKPDAKAWSVIEEGCAIVGEP